MPDDVRTRLEHYAKDDPRAFCTPTQVRIMARDALDLIDELEGALAAMTAEAEEFAGDVARSGHGSESDPHLYEAGALWHVADAMRWLAERGLFEVTGGEGRMIRGRFVKREHADA